MESGSEFYAGEGLQIDPKWLIDPKLLFVGPRIGEGAHAKVYEGKYKNQNVAIKIVHKGDTPEEMIKREGRFLREVTMLSRVQHKNLVKFIGACLEPVMVVVTELLVGGSLRKYLVGLRPRSLEPRVAVGFALDIARAMECLHAHGIIHRDLKPENLLLTADQRTVKLVDLGLAREETLTEMMTAETGTYRWMAPELYSTVTLSNNPCALALDAATLQFSFLRAPAAMWDSTTHHKYRVGESPVDGRLCLASLERDGFQLWVRGSGEGSDHGWVLERHVRMQEVLDAVPWLPRDILIRHAHMWLSDIDAGRTGKVFIASFGYGRFSYHMDTGKLECLSTDDGMQYGHPIFPYFSAPPFDSSA